MRSFLFVPVLALTFAVLGCSNKPTNSFGEPMKLSDADAIPVGTVLANPAAYEGNFVRLVGTVDKVCERKGCWITMTDEKANAPLYVKFTCPVGDKRLIPMEARGLPVVVEGTFQKKQVTEDYARHMAEEGGATLAEIDAIKGPQTQFVLASPSARIDGLNNAKSSGN